MRGGEGFYKQFWAEKKSRIDCIKRRGQVEVEKTPTRLVVTAPQDPDWTKGAKLLAGDWKPKTGRWTFLHGQQPAVAELIGKVYGVEMIPEWMKEELG